MSLLDGVERLRGTLDYHLSRHNLLTANLAQVDTPGYRPVDLKRPAAASFGEVLATQMQATQEGHFGAPLTVGGATPASAGFEVVVDGDEAAGPDGNAVSIDREAVKIAANHLRYEIMSQLTASKLSGLAWAANDGKNV